MNIDFIAGLLFSACCIALGIFLFRDLIVSRLIDRWLSSKGIATGKPTDSVSVKQYNEGMQKLGDILNKSLQDTVRAMGQDLDRAINESVNETRDELYEEIVEFINNELTKISQQMQLNIKKEVERYERNQK